MKTEKYSMSVIMPAYNEEQSIESAAIHTMETFQRLKLDFEIIIVDDKSMDSTGEIADRLAEGHADIQTLHHEENQGSGGAFKTGIAAASKDFVIFVPVDNPLDPEDLEAYLPRIDVCDIVVGFRMERVGYSKFARFSSFIYNRIFVPLLFNIGVNDVNWIQVYRRNLFTDDIITFNSKSLFWLVEILIRAKRNRLIIAEVPATMRKRMYGRATCTRFSVMVQTFTEMIRFFLMIRKEGKK